MCAILSRTRLRLRKLGIEVCSILDTGYMLKSTGE